MMKIGNFLLVMGMLFTASTLSFGQVASLQPIFGENHIEGNEIKWFAESPEATQFFILQRSGDGVHFKPVAMIQKIDNTISYSYVDTKANNENWFYRVVNVDNQGVGQYTGAVYMEYAYAMNDETSEKPPVNITMNDHIAQEVNCWLNELEFPTITKLGMVANITELPQLSSEKK